DVLQYDLATLTHWLGEREAAWLYARVRGIDHGEVESHGEAKSISRDETFPVDIDDDDELARELLALVTRAATDLRGDGLTARTIRWRTGAGDFRAGRGGRRLPTAVISARVILEGARTLFSKPRPARRIPARLLGVGLSSLAADAAVNQLTLFEKRETKT